MSNDASRYDKMISWDTRLLREIPVISTFLESGQILDMACSSGRHSLALEKEGFSCLGIDIQEEFIEIANKLVSENKSDCQFLTLDGTKEEFQVEVRKIFPEPFDGAILLGNAIANLGSKINGIALVQNVYNSLKSGGRFFVQTVNRPEKIHYVALRVVGSKIIQRIMIPIEGETYNIEFHVNVIEDGKYTSQSDDNEFFMYSIEEFENLVTKIGFTVLEKFGGYTGEILDPEGGMTTLWKLKK